MFSDCWVGDQSIMGRTCRAEGSRKNCGTGCGSQLCLFQDGKSLESEQVVKSMDFGGR